MPRSLQLLYFADDCSLDAPAVYVESLARLCAEAQILGKPHISYVVDLLMRVADRHLALLGGEVQPTPYPSVTKDNRERIDARLRRASDFFANVVCKFVLRDMALLLDKHSMLLLDFSESSN